MPLTATITGKTGAGLTMTAQVFTNISRFTIDCINNVLNLVDSSDSVTFVDINAATTITATKSGSTYTLTIS